jgi:hypothetical protein
VVTAALGPLGNAQLRLDHPVRFHRLWPYGVVLALYLTARALLLTEFAPLTLDVTMPQAAAFLRQKVTLLGQYLLGDRSRAERRASRRPVVLLEWDEQSQEFRRAWQSFSRCFHGTQ